MAAGRLNYSELVAAWLPVFGNGLVQATVSNRRDWRAAC